MLDILFEDNPNQPRLERVGPAARAVYLVRMFGGQVRNGGFRQFLANSSGDFTAETLHALRHVGALVSAELLEQALSVFPGRRVPRKQSDRLLLLFAIDGRVKELLDKLDHRAYREVDPIEGAGRESLDGLLLAYMQGHAGEVVIAEQDAGAAPPRD